MSYDLHGSWDAITNHQAHMKDKFGGYEIDRAVNLFIDGGCKPSQLVLGVPFYGRAMKGVRPGSDPTKPGLYQPHSGNAYNEQGILSFGEIEKLISGGGFITYWDEEAKASWAYSASEGIFISYDSVQAVKMKVDYVKQKGMKGAMYWLMGQDDSKDTLLSTLYTGLRGDKS
ncbi:hypothetical protein HDV05_007952 [Chytridiales sp. JEL 0842]|nr:hypothetical protein HDV05_007952 [Chytridiales sp. JEL 0842]